MSQSEAWYVVKQTNGECEILPAAQLPSTEPAAPQEQWGPFQSQGEAIARRVGLIRAGKCQPK